MKRALLISLVAATMLSSCGEEPLFDLAPSVPVTGTPPMLLSEMNLVRWEGDGFVYNERVVPYALNTPLFSDYTRKDRAIYVPPGASARYDARDVFDFPVGSAIIKSFSFAEDLREPNLNRRVIETRVLIRTADGWRAWPYRWNDAQTDAELKPSGDVLTITFTDPRGAAQTSNYLVPQRNQCQSCHERKDDDDETFITPIGPRARDLHREFMYPDGAENQLTRLAREGLLTGAPADLSSITPAVDFASVEARGVAALSEDEAQRAARDYLDVNCAHCHNPAGVQGITSQLFLNWDNDDPFNLGICKRPGSAGAGTGGLDHDIVPGSPDESILLFRVQTTEVGAMMPLLGRSLTHDTGVALLRRWISEMPAETCE